MAARDKVGQNASIFLDWSVLMYFDRISSALTWLGRPAGSSGAVVDRQSLRQLAYVCLTFVLLGVPNLSYGQQFQEVTSSVGFVDELKKSWGNPIWGDMNNDGFLDMIVPDHGLAASHGPMVYLNNAGATFIDYRDHLPDREGPAVRFERLAWFSFGDFDNDGNLDLYITEGSKKGYGEKRDFSAGQGNGIFDYLVSLPEW